MEDILATTNVCNALTLIIQDMASVLGGSNNAYVFLYLMFFIIPAILSFGIGRNALFGLLGGTAGHITVMLLGASGCLPLPKEYLIMGNFIYIMIMGMFFYVWRTSRSTNINW